MRQQKRQLDPGTGPSVTQPQDFRETGDRLRNRLLAQRQLAEVASLPGVSQTSPLRQQGVPHVPLAGAVGWLRSLSGWTNLSRGAT